MNKFLEWFGRVWAWMRGLYRVLSLIRFNIVLGTICSLVLFTSQGQDVLRAIVEAKGWLNLIQTFCFLLFTASFGWTAWYSAKVMFLFKFPVEIEQDGALKRNSIETIKRHVARSLGPSIMFLVCAALITAARSYNSLWETTSLQLLGMALFCFGSGILVLYIVYFRREWLHLSDWDNPKNQNLTSFKELPKVPRRWFYFASSASLFALVIFAYNSGIIGPMIGTGGILMLWATSLVSIGGALVYIGNQYQVPIIGVFVVLAIFFSQYNDNHRVRQLKDMRPYENQEAEDYTFPYAIVNKLSGKMGVRSRAISQTEEPFEDYFEAWFSDLQKKWKSHQLHTHEKVPIILVSTEGGGIRAAYWTAAVLAELQDRSEVLVGENALPLNFARHVFSISGVSGGSLGATVFASLIKEKLMTGTYHSACSGLPQHAGYRQVASTILQQDFLSPTIGVMLFPDMLQRFLPFGVLDDRAVALEHAWERSWEQCTGSKRFSEAFDDLWDDDQFDVPLLFLNSTVVETGQRLIMQPLPFAQLTSSGDGQESRRALLKRPFQHYFNNALDGTTIMGAQIPVSTAVHMSARFTYVSPAGTIIRQDVPKLEHQKEVLDPKVIRIVDGGYFENSGAVTTDEILLAIERIAVIKGLRVHPIVIHISNEPLKPDSRQKEAFPGTDAILPEVLSPIWALLNVRPARGYQAREELGRRAELGLSVPSKSEELRGSFFHFQLCEYDRPLPLGWILSNLTRQDIDEQFIQSREQKKSDKQQGTVKEATKFNERNAQAVLEELAGNYRKRPYARIVLRDYQKNCVGVIPKG